MTHSQPGVSAFLQIVHRAPKTKEQKVPQPLFSPHKIMLRIHWPQNVILGHLPVKRPDKASKPVFPYHLKQVFFGYLFNTHNPILRHHQNGRLPERTLAALRVHYRLKPR